MKRFFIPMLCIVFSVFSQGYDSAYLENREIREKQDIAINNGPIFTVVEQMPEFPGGVKAFHTYVDDNLKYPEDEKKNRVTGTVYVAFTVQRTGNIQDFKILKGIGEKYDAEAMRVVESMPKWIPGKHLVDTLVNLKVPLS